MLLKLAVERKIKYWKPLLGLQGWEHSIVVHDKQSDEDKDLPYDEQAAMDVESFPKYLRFKVNVYPKLAQRIKERDYNFDLYIVHELSHVLLSEYDRLLDEFIGSNDTYFQEAIAERTTEQFARAILRASGRYPKGTF